MDLNSGILIVRWFDNKAFQLISNYIGIEPIDEVERWSKSAGKMITVSRPKIVKVFNSEMGGVDLFDMFEALYKLDHKIRRWYMRIFYCILVSSVVNAWLQYPKDFDSMKLSKANESFSGKQKQMSLIEFTMNISSSFLKNAKPVTVRKSGRPSSSFMEKSTTYKQPKKAPHLKDVPADTRFDNVDHWPVHRDERPRCFLCKEKTRWGCSKYKKGLCITKERNCFRYFHDIGYFH